jgi:outer membrane protein TolC
VQDQFDVSGTLNQTPLMLSFDELRLIADESRPVLKGLNHKIEQSRLARKFFEIEYYPDIDFGVSYGQRDDSGAVERPDFFSASVSINIPLWYRTKESSKVSEEKANERRANELFNEKKNSIDFRLKALTAEVDSYSREIELLRTGLIPQSVLSYESSVSGYEVNKVGFIALINNQISLYNYKIEYYRAVADHENSLAGLEETAGTSIYPSGGNNAAAVH